MKIGFNLKLSISIIIVFGLLFVGFALWTPLKIRYYIGQLYSQDKTVRVTAVSALIDIGKAGISALGKEFCSEDEAIFLAKYWKDVNASIEGSHKVPAITRSEWTSKKKVEGLISNYTPLHLAVEMDYLKAAELLIAKGADLNSTGAYYIIPPKENQLNPGWIRPIGPVRYVGTPLHIAAREGNVEIIELLISKGARINISTGTYTTTCPSTSTPLDYANDEKTRLILRKHGAKTAYELEAAGVPIE
jgi:hypothetical protein